MDREMAEAAGVEENVVIAAGECEVTILPRFGGKISSIKLKGRELLQQPLTPIEPRSWTMGFDEGDASGWDECLPSVAACSVPFAGGEARIPDHGDLWRVAWEQVETKDEEQRSNSVSLKGKCFSLPLELERTVYLKESADGGRLDVFYKLTNTGTDPAPWSWAAHPLFAVDKGDTINLPDGMRKLRLEGSGGGRLGTHGDTVSWPVAKLATDGVADLRVAKAADSGIGDKLFAGPLGFDQNWCELSRPSAGVKILVRFNSYEMPYLGLWLCYGGWPEREGPKQMCVAIEPSTAPVDLLAEAGPWSRMLAAGESYEWAMTVDLRAL